MSSQPAPRDDQDRAQKRAFYRRRDHDNIEAMQNHVIAEIARRAAAPYNDQEQPPRFEMPTNVRHLISAIQGAHGGGQVPFEEFERDYLSIGKQLQFTGSEDAIRSRVRDWIDALEEWQFAVGYELFTISKGGQIIGYRADGAPIRQKTRFIDHLEPHADEGVQRARFSEKWKEHPGRAIEDQVESVIKKLPRLGTRKESGKEKKQGAPMPVDRYERQQEDAIKKMVEDRAGKIDLRGGDGALWVRRLSAQLKDLADSLEKTARARGDFASLTVVEESGDATAWMDGYLDDLHELATPAATASDTGETDATDYLCKKPADPKAGNEPSPDEPLGRKNPTQSPVENPPTQEVSALQNGKDADLLLQWALFWGVQQGIPVFPVHSVDDGICTCPCSKLCQGGEHKCGSECESKGKHPIAKLAPKGSLNATTDEATIRRWWSEVPHANIGGRMGGKIRLLAFDIDPRAGGDASFYDLVEAFGDQWTQTLRHKTGSGGYHLFFTIPEGIEFHRAKIAPGIDISVKLD